MTPGPPFQSRRAVLRKKEEVGAGAGWVSQEADSEESLDRMFVAECQRKPPQQRGKEGNRTGQREEVRPEDSLADPIGNTGATWPSQASPFGQS